jgi:hypothetical protein
MKAAAWTSLSPMNDQKKSVPDDERGFGFDGRVSVGE